MEKSWNYVFEFLWEPWQEGLLHDCTALLAHAISTLFLWAGSNTAIFHFVNCVIKSFMFIHNHVVISTEYMRVFIFFLFFCHLL